METPAPAPAAGLSQLDRVVNTFFAPTKTMQDIRRSTSWWVPWLLVSLVSYSLIFSWQQKIGFEKLMDNQIQLNPKAAERMEKATPEQRDQQMKVSIAITKGISYGYPFMMLLTIVIVGGVLMAVFNFGFGAKIRYGQALAVTAYSYLPGMIATVLAVVTVFLADPDGYDMRRPVASNLGALVSMTDHPALATFLSTFDIFSIWYILLMAIGMTSVSDKKIKTSNAFIAIFSVYFLVKLFGTAMAAMF